MQLKLGKFARDVAKAKVRRLPALHRCCSLCSGSSQRYPALNRTAIRVKSRTYNTRPAPLLGTKVNKTMTVLVLLVMMMYGALVYAPLAAVLVEMFPARIRYTSMSLPYNIGNGWFGGFLPASVFAIVAAKGDMYAGLWYPVSIAIVSFLVAARFLKETKTLDINRND